MKNWRLITFLSICMILHVIRKPSPVKNIKEIKPSPFFSVVYHHGKNAWGGHYTSDVCHPIHGWIRADDTRLKIVPANYVLKPIQGKDPYVLFYHRTDFMP